jgi:hypothetical protein
MHTISGPNPIPAEIIVQIFENILFRTRFILPQLAVDSTRSYATTRLLFTDTYATYSMWKTRKIYTGRSRGSVVLFFGDYPWSCPFATKLQYSGESDQYVWSCYFPAIWNEHFNHWLHARIRLFFFAFSSWYEHWLRIFHHRSTRSYYLIWSLFPLYRPPRQQRYRSMLLKSRNDRT